MTVWQEWLEAAQAGDGEARERILRELEPLVRKLAAQAVPSLRDDLAQELRLELWKAVDAFRIQPVPCLFDSTTSKKVDKGVVETNISSLL